MATEGRTRTSLANSVLGFLFVGTLIYGGLALFGWFDSNAEKAESEARKCSTARRINLMTDAERYCANAITYLRTEPNAPPLTTARVHTEAAALAMAQKHLDDSADHCRLAVAAWHDAKDDSYRREREESVDACEKVIAAVALTQRGPNDKSAPLTDRNRRAN
jgi:hypothetical protein